MSEDKQSPEIPKGEIKSNWDLIMLLFIMIKTRRKWWLLPLLLVLAFLGVFVSLTGNNAVLPAIYALF